MTELENLLAQRKEIDRKIKELQSPTYEIWDNGSLVAEMSARDSGEQWCLKIKEVDFVRMLNKQVPQRKQIIRTRTKEEAVEQLAKLICNLDKLYAKITGTHIYKRISIHLNESVPPTGT